MNEEAFAARCARIAEAVGLRVKPSALTSIAADVAAKLATTDSAQAIASELRDLRQVRPFAFLSAGESET